MNSIDKQRTWAWAWSHINEGQSMPNRLCDEILNGTRIHYDWFWMRTQATLKLIIVLIIWPFKWRVQFFIPKRWIHRIGQVIAKTTRQANYVSNGMKRKKKERENETEAIRSDSKMFCKNECTLITSPHKKWTNSSYAINWVTGVCDNKHLCKYSNQILIQLTACSHTFCLCTNYSSSVIEWSRDKSQNKIEWIVCLGKYSFLFRIQFPLSINNCFSNVH